MEGTDGKAEAAEELRAKMSWLQDEAGVQARIYAEKARNYARDNPLKVLLGGIILGLIIGAMIPRTTNIKIEDKRKSIA